MADSEILSPNGLTGTIFIAGDPRRHLIAMMRKVDHFEGTTDQHSRVSMTLASAPWFRPIDVVWAAPATFSASIVFTSYVD